MEQKADGRKTAMTPEARVKRAKKAGLTASAVMTSADKTTRAELGGYAAAKRMTPEQRRERAKKAINARYAKRNPAT